jgi:hypothetical protein
MSILLHHEGRREQCHCPLFQTERPQIFSESLQYFYLIWTKNGQDSMKKGLFASLGDRHRALSWLFLCRSCLSHTLIIPSLLLQSSSVSVKLSGENGLGYEEKERKIFRI